uniref:Major facilitator superfamily (MFS) profile domain-containing protein n=1 Tax=Kalanchoe fedtschenkoi TaxID=63787 RepID=A0A7N0U6Q3_KALFE
MEKGTCGGSVIHLFITWFLSYFAGYIVSPALTDVTMSAVCPGRDECSLAIYLSSIQQAVIGLGMAWFTPLIGNLSDQYGRKALLTLPVTAAIIPLAILAYSRATNFFYAYFAFRTVTDMVGFASINCLALAFLADNTRADKRASAFGILSGVSTAAFVCATVSARFLPETQTFQVGAIVSIASAVYMRIFLKDTKLEKDGEHLPLLSQTNVDHQDVESSKQVQNSEKIPSVLDIVSLFRDRKIVSQAAVVVFFSSLVDCGMQYSILYYLKARFHFNKDQFADVFLIGSLAGTVSLLFVMPLLVEAIGAEKLLSFSLLYGFISWGIYSLSWSPWVPYALALSFFFTYLPGPCIRSIVSKQVGSHEQGKVQGCISGISSLTAVVAPLVFSPLTALFLSEQAPFYYPGFSILCIGSMNLIAFIQSLMIRSDPCTAISNSSSDNPSNVVGASTATEET